MPKIQSPEKIKIRYNVTKASAGSFGEWMIRILSRRLGVSPPGLQKITNMASAFHWKSGTILLNNKLYGSSLADFVQVCIHEFAHYMHYKKVGAKEYDKIKRKHGKDFFDWLRVVARAAYRQPKGDLLYNWGTEYKYIYNLAVKSNIIPKIEKGKHAKKA